MINEITEDEEEVEYITFKSKTFKVKTNKEVLEAINGKEKITEEQITFWVQSKMRPLGLIRSGVFDKECAELLSHIFKNKLEELKKQSKL